jgi:hypothetical protein
VKWQTQARPVAPQPIPRPWYKVYMFFLIRTLKDGFKSICLSTQYQSVSCHYILYYIVPTMNLMKWQTEPRPEAPQPTPRPWYKVYVFFLIHTPKGWIQVHMFINPISVWFWPLHTILYSSENESNEMTDPTKTSSTPTKTKTIQQNLCFLPNTYS